MSTRIERGANLPNSHLNTQLDAVFMQVLHALEKEKANNVNLLSSTSWRITKPLRVVILALRNARKATSLTRKNKIHASIGNAPARKDRTRGEPTPISRKPELPAVSVEPLAEHSTNDVPPIDLAVHAHVYYEELAQEISRYLSNIPFPFTLYLSVTHSDKTPFIKQLFDPLDRVKDLTVEVVPNVGRDIAPMLVTFGRRLCQHDLVLHIHTKRSPHNPDLRGWRAYMMRALLGTPAIVNAVVRRFATDSHLGILFPAPYLPVQPFLRLGGNALRMALLMQRAGQPLTSLLDVSKTHFPAGSMFWFRGKAIRRLVNMQLLHADFDAELGQDDATVAHAIERLFPYLASLDGLDTRSYLPRSMYNKSTPGALPLSPEPFGKDVRRTGRPLTIIFDHDKGGGANSYSRRLATDYVAAGHLVVRIYFASHTGSWVLQTIMSDSGAFFGTSEPELLFQALAPVLCRGIIVNSLVGYPSVDKIINLIRQFAHSKNAEIEFKVHDFFAVCPSQHLLSHQNAYCGVPDDQDTCRKCLQDNTNAEPNSAPNESIARWRAPFSQLLSDASAVTFFDQTSIRIFQRAFDLERVNTAIRPHEDDYFQVDSEFKVDLPNLPLHIGLLGTMNKIKGAAVVNDLATRIEKHDLNIPITLLGRKTTALHPSVRIHGGYDVRQLPQLVNHYEITVVLFPAIVPETFSYTISEAMKMNLPLVAFDLGAQGRRVGEYRLGRVVPIGSSASALIDALVAVWEAARRGVI